MCLASLTDPAHAVWSAGFGPRCSWGCDTCRAWRWGWRCRPCWTTAARPAPRCSGTPAPVAASPSCRESQMRHSFLGHTLKGTFRICRLNKSTCHSDEEELNNTCCTRKPGENRQEVTSENLLRWGWETGNDDIWFLKLVFGGLSPDLHLPTIGSVGPVFAL